MSLVPFYISKDIVSSGNLKETNLMIFPEGISLQMPPVSYMQEAIVIHTFHVRVVLTKRHTQFVIVESSQEGWGSEH